MKELNIDALKEHIALSDWEKKLLPLFLFKGTKPLHIRKFWNITYAMFITECETYGDGVKLTTPNGDHGKLCGVTSQGPVSHTSLHGAFSRLRAAKELTNSISPAFTEYVEWLHPSPCVLVPVPLVTYDSHRDAIGWWRKNERRPRKIRVYKSPSVKMEDRCYPYVRCATQEQTLVTQVYNMIPKTVPYDIRGDLCQDILVDILAGDLTIENIPNEIRRYISRARKFMPAKYKMISINDMIPGTDKEYAETLAFNLAFAWGAVDDEQGYFPYEQSDNDLLEDVSWKNKPMEDKVDILKYRKKYDSYQEQYIEVPREESEF